MDKFFIFKLHVFKISDLWKIRMKPRELQPARLSYVGWSGRSSHLLAIYRNTIYKTSDATQRNGWVVLGSNENYEQDFFCVGLPDWTYSGARYLVRVLYKT